MGKKSSAKLSSGQSRPNKKRQGSRPNVFRGSTQPSTYNSETDLDETTPLTEKIAEKQPIFTNININTKNVHKKERLSNSAMSVYSYVGSEVKRIGIIGSIILIALLSLTFVLR